MELMVEMNWLRPTQKEREEHDATNVLFRDWYTHCMMGRGRTHHHVNKQKSELTLKECHNNK